MHMATDTSNTDTRDLLKVLSDCSKICRNLTESSSLTMARNLNLPDVSKLIRLVGDAAASCDITILLIERKSHIVIDFLQVCEELTMECAWECSNYGFDICKQCADACEQVAKACLPFVIHKEAV
jgi:hypothetical protein